MNRYQMTFAIDPDAGSVRIVLTTPDGRFLGSTERNIHAPLDRAHLHWIGHEASELVQRMGADLFGPEPSLLEQAFNEAYG